MVENSTDIEILEAVKPKVEVAVKLQNESQVTVHCTVKSSTPFAAIRVWKSTFLMDEHSDHSSKLLHAEGVVFQPHWQPVPHSGVARFTLIFSSLPKDCKSFHFEEVIPEAGAWSVRSIQRNETDVYRITLS